MYNGGKIGLDGYKEVEAEEFIQIKVVKICTTFLNVQRNSKMLNILMKLIGFILYYNNGFKCVNRHIYYHNFLQLFVNLLQISPPCYINSLQTFQLWWS